MRSLMFVLCLFLLPGPALADEGQTSFTLGEAISHALRNNPAMNMARQDVEIGSHEIRRAAAEKFPKIDLTGGLSRSRYASPVTPISGSPLEGGGFPEFDDTLYDLGVSFTLPLYRGGRLDRAVVIAGLARSMKEDMAVMGRQELIYNLTAVFNRISQLERLLETREASVRQLEAHKRNVIAFLEAGTAPRVELLKTEAELRHAKQNVLATSNAIEGTHEVLKALMGIDDGREISIIHEAGLPEGYPSLDESLGKALSQRPDYSAILKKVKMAQERRGFVAGKQLPSVNLVGEFTERSGENLDFRENWNIGLRFSVPLFDGGTVREEVGREKLEIRKAQEEERALRIEITREVRDAHLNIRNARERIEVADTAVDAAQENLRIENLKYEAGAGTSADVIDAQTVLLRAETDHHQAVHDMNIALASLRKATGEDIYGGGH